jgi:uncharacterized membrane protein
VLLLTPVTIAKAVREPHLRMLPFVAAALFLLLLAGWSIDIRELPDFTPPQDRWTPSVVRALMETAAFMAGCFAASGLWFERKAAYPLAWSSLTASVPVLTLAVCYARVAEFSPRLDWAVFALLLAAGLTGAAPAALREQGRWVAADAEGRAHAGVHAAGAVAALALGCAMLLREHWLTLAVSLFLPALAWIEAKADLPPLRKVALAVAAVVLSRLLLNWYVVGYVFGGLPVADGLLIAYGVPAASFALAAWMFGRRGDDLTVGVLEAGSVAFVTVLVALEIHHAASPDAFVTDQMGFVEAA